MYNAMNYEKVPEGALIVGENQYYSRDSFKTKLNNNVLVVGTSGTGKTRSIVIPNILQATGSYVISDPKGYLYKSLAPYLKEKGYNVLKMDFIHPENSYRYNPIEYCKTTSDIRRIAHSIVFEISGSSSFDPFWDQASEILLSACLGYIIESDMKQKDKNIFKVLDLIKLANRVSSEGARGRSLLDKLMEDLEIQKKKKGGRSWAVDRYNEYNTCADRTQASINISTLSKFSSFDTLEMRKMLSGNDLDFEKIGQEPTALFVEVSDTDRSSDVIINLFYSQIMNTLCAYADEKCENNRLKVPVQFILDDFATNAKIANFENSIANIRSRGISAMLMVQSEAQIMASYDRNAQTIIDNCDTYVYMGGSNPRMAENIAIRANKPATKILHMPLSMSWIFRRGQEPVFVNNFDLEWFLNEKGVVLGKAPKRWRFDRLKK